jgi:ribosome-associated protein
LVKKQSTTAAKLPKSVFVKTIIEAMQELKGVDVTVLDLRNIHEASADYFIICHGTSSTHISGLTDRIQKNVWEILGERPYHTEGRQGKHWLLLDYFTIVVHVFDREKRDFYDIEHLWSDAVVLKF